MVVDASFSKARWRDAAARVAADTDAELTELRCVLPATVASARLAARAAQGGDASDATASIAGVMAEEFDRWPGASTVGTLPPLDDVLPAVLERLDVPAPRRSAAAATPP